MSYQIKVELILSMFSSICVPVELVDFMFSSPGQGMLLFWPPMSFGSRCIEVYSLPSQVRWEKLDVRVHATKGSEAARKIQVQTWCFVCFAVFADNAFVLVWGWGDYSLLWARC